MTHDHTIGRPQGYAPTIRRIGLPSPCIVGAGLAPALENHESALDHYPMVCDQDWMSNCGYYTTRYEGGISICCSRSTWAGACEPEIAKVGWVLTAMHLTSVGMAYILLFQHFYYGSLLFG